VMPRGLTERRTVRPSWATDFGDDVRPKTCVHA
jgi:hypothetical protein